MEYIVETQREIPVVATPDVLIVGGGPTGIAAALASARMGVKTMLVEKYGFLGGNLTTSMVNPIFTFHDINGRQVIKGIADEIVKEMTRQGVSLNHVTDLTFDNASMTPFDPEGIKVILFNMLKDAGVELLLHSLVTNVQRLNNSVKTVFIENKSGRQALRVNYIVDCSGDADVAAFSGVPFIKGRKEDGFMQPASLYFRIGGVNRDELCLWMKSHRSLLKDSPTDKEIDNQKEIALLGLNELVEKAIALGDLDPEVAPRILMYELPNGLFSVNTTRLQNVDGTNVLDLTEAEIRLRKQVLQVYDFLKREIGGFERSYVVDTGVQVGIRETRHLVGDYTLTEEDVLYGKAFDDGVSCGTFAIDIHPPKGKKQIFTGSGKAVYEIPYRCMLPQGIDNLLVAGRPISATHTAFGSIRVMATCMAMGQGAGTAVALAAKRSCSTRDIDIAELRKELMRGGQYLLNEQLNDNIDKALALNRKSGSGERAAHFNPFLKQRG